MLDLKFNLRYKMVTFDHFELKRLGHDKFDVKTTVCKDCAKKYSLELEGTLSMSSELNYCGVEGCYNKTRDMYRVDLSYPRYIRYIIAFNEGEVLTTPDEIIRRKEMGYYNREKSI